MSSLADDGLYDDEVLAAIERRRPVPDSPGGGTGVAGWRRTSVSGSLAAAVLLGLRDALEPPADEPAVVVDHHGDAGGDGRVTVHLDPDSPRASHATIRP